MVGLVADPGLPAVLAQALRRSLPAELSRAVDAGVDWDVDVAEEALPLNPDGEIRLLDSGRRLCAREGWDFLVCLTELPRRTDTRLLLSDADMTAGAGLISLPALGLAPLRPRALRAVVQLVGRLIGGRQDERESYVALSGVRGRLRLLSGMVRTNRPWRLVPNLSTALAASAATAAFGIFYSSIWAMADALSPLRLAVITALAIGAMVTWLVAQNGLWERPAGRRARERAVLYNAATVLTLLVGVACMYVLLFGMTLLAGVAVIDAGYLQSVLGHPTGPADYLTLTWLASSMGTVAGALGSSVESEQAVRQATYGRRELERQARTDEHNESAAQDAYEE